MQFRNFQKPKIKLKKDPLKLKKIKNVYKEASNKKSKQTVLNVEIMIQNTISKFSKTKNQTEKRPPILPKNQKKYIRRP